VIFCCLSSCCRRVVDACPCVVVLSSSLSVALSTEVQSLSLPRWSLENPPRHAVVVGVWGGRASLCVSRLARLRGAGAGRGAERKNLFRPETKSATLGRWSAATTTQSAASSAGPWTAYPTHIKQ